MPEPGAEVNQLVSPVLTLASLGANALFGFRIGVS